jgi:hypothetical protein
MRGLGKAQGETQLEDVPLRGLSPDERKRTVLHE